VQHEKGRPSSAGPSRRCPNVASNRRGIPIGTIISAALLFLLVTTLYISFLSWPNFFAAVTDTTTTTTNYTSSRGEESVRQIETVEQQQNLTFWQVVGTLLIPLGGGLLIAWGGFKFSQKQRERDEVLENQQAQDTAIQSYIDQMSDLLVDRHLRSLPTGSDIHKLAEARTLEVLLGLDGERKRRPLKLVYGLGLINNRLHTAQRDGAPLDVENPSLNNPDSGERDGALLDLENLSLDHADLTELSLRDACLRFADLRGADLQGSDLRGANLSYADLRGANLTNTDLSYVNLSGANLLPYDEYEPARLSLHNLKDHPLPSDEYLRSLAKLQKNRLRNHPSRLTRWVKNRVLGREAVTFTDLTDAKLDHANLTGAILANADLSVTRRQSLNRKQIECAIGNDKTKLPDTDEFKPLPRMWTNGEGIEAQIKKVEVQVLEERKKNAVEVWEERIKNTVEQINEHSNE
jgi:uncharacterized protein YjbI with pentapeptide repeats